jgi:hypothetical protein
MGAEKATGSPRKRAKLSVKVRKRLFFIGESLNL